jgi:hypothetical protein
MSDHDETLDQNFNDAELQDIMNEIESLEKEFIEQEASETPSADTEMDNVQSELEEDSESIEHESEEATMEASDSEDAPEEYEQDMSAASEEVTEEATEDPIHEETHNVVSMDEHRAAAQPTQTHHEAPTGEMSFSGQGQMDFNMSFSLGDKEASLRVEKGKLKVTVSGVELYLSEHGCEVEMAGGVKFSVPLEGAQTNSAGKKAA